MLFRVISVWTNDNLSIWILGFVEVYHLVYSFLFFVGSLWRLVTGVQIYSQWKWYEFHFNRKVQGFTYVSLLISESSFLCSFEINSYSLLSTLHFHAIWDATSCYFFFFIIDDATCYWRTKICTVQVCFEFKFVKAKIISATIHCFGICVNHLKTVFLFTCLYMSFSLWKQYDNWYHSYCLVSLNYLRTAFLFICLPLNLMKFL